MDIEKEAEYFIKELPYKQGVYAGRNWGHEWHSLCSYHGKLKPAIAHFLVSEFTEEGQINAMTKLLDMLEDNDDVQDVYHNWDMPSED